MILVRELFGWWDPQIFLDDKKPQILLLEASLVAGKGKGFQAEWGTVVQKVVFRRILVAVELIVAAVL